MSIIIAITKASIILASVKGQEVKSIKLERSDSWIITFIKIGKKAMAMIFAFIGLPVSPTR